MMEKGYDDLVAEARRNFLPGDEGSVEWRMADAIEALLAENVGLRRHIATRFSDENIPRTDYGDFKEWLAEHDRKVLIEYEKRRKPEPIHIDNIDGRNASQWLATHDAEVRAAAPEGSRADGLPVPRDTPEGDE